MSRHEGEFMSLGEGEFLSICEEEFLSICEGEFLYILEGELLSKGEGEFLAHLASSRRAFALKNDPKMKSNSNIRIKGIIEIKVVQLHE